MSTGRVRDASSKLRRTSAPGEPEPLERYPRRLIEIGERDAEAPRLGPRGRAETAGEQSGQNSRRAAPASNMRY